MAEQDSLSNFDFGKVSKPGKFLKFEAGKPVTVRILTKDPVVQERVFTDKKTGEVNISTKFCFIVWNFTDERAQILSAGPSMAKTFQRIGTDPDFGSNLQKCDIKISPEGEMLDRVYDINVLRHSGSEKEITKAMVDEAKELDLDNDVTEGNKGRLSQYEPNGVKPGRPSQANSDGVDEPAPEEPDEVITDIDPDEPINLDDIPF
jgi:hypothetical protein